jgi:hypothetical protein
LRSPENYVGYSRTQNFASPRGADQDRRATYAIPPRLSLNEWALAGEWTIGGQATILNGARGRLAYRFHARDLHLVMGPATRGATVRFSVSIDGRPPGPARGLDVDEHGNGAVGKVRLGKMLAGDTGPERRVIGVVKDVRAGYGGDAAAAVYWPVTRDSFRAMTVLPRPSGDPRAVSAGMRTAAQRLDPRLFVARPAPVAMMLDRTIANARFETLLFTMFGVLGLVVATIGVYGLMACWAGSRTHEMGVRMAFGADPARLKSLVLTQASRPLVGGLAVGLVGAFLLTRRLDSLLYGITPHDPATFAAVVAVLVAAGLAAAYVPARRAARVDPIVALRAE